MGSSPIRLPLVHRDFFIVLSQESSLLQIEMDYSDSRFSFRPVIFLEAPARSSPSLSLIVPHALSASLQSKERYRCLEKGFQMEVMVIPKILFQMWLKFRRNQQWFIGVMTHCYSTLPLHFLQNFSLSRE